MGINPIAEASLSGYEKGVAQCRNEVERLLAEIADSAAREADLRNRAEVAEAKVENLEVWKARLEEMIEHYGLGPEPEMASDETINYHVWKVEDGHPWKESQWPSLRDTGQCDLCTAPEHLHMQVKP